MAISASEKYLLNKMNAIANKVQLGTLIENAENVTAGEIALATGSILLGTAGVGAALDIKTSGQIIVGNGTTAVSVAVTGDISLSSAGVVAITADSIINADVKTDAAIAFSKLAALTDGYVLIGNGSNVATAVAVTGDVTVSNAGVTAIAGDVIINADIKTDAAIAYSKLAALTSGNILVGSAGNVATSVAMSGVIAISNAGLTSFATNAVERVSTFSVGFAALNAAGTTVAALFGTAIPDDAIITQVYYEVTDTFIDNGTAGDADSATIKMGIEDQDDDTVVAVAISNGGNPWDAGRHAGVPVNTVATFLKLTAARQLAVTWTAGTGDSTALTAGAMTVFVKWVQGA